MKHNTNGSYLAVDIFPALQTLKLMAVNGEVGIQVMAELYHAVLD